MNRILSGASCCALALLLAVAPATAGPSDLVYPLHIDFGPAPEYQITSRVLVVTNAGPDSVTISPSIDETFYVLSMSGHTAPSTIAPGALQIYTVSIRPDYDNPVIDGEISLRPDLPPIHVTATAVDQDGGYGGPLAVDLGGVRLGETGSGGISVLNTGPFAMPFRPHLIGCSPELVLSTNFTSYYLEPLASGFVRLDYTPTALGDLVCGFRPSYAVYLPTVRVSARGLQPDIAWSSAPTRLAFPVAAPGQAVELATDFCNTGPVAMDLAPELDGHSAPYEIVAGGEAETLAPGACRRLRVRFAPDVAGWYAARLVLGEGLPALPLTGGTGALPDSCPVEIRELDFGAVAIGQEATREIRYANLSGETFVAPPVSDSPQFVIGDLGGPVRPGEVGTFTVTYRPDVTGPAEALVSPGHLMCGEIVCSGEGFEMPTSAPNRIGVYFDGSFVRNAIALDRHESSAAAIVLMNPGDDEGIWGWECRLESEGEVLLYDWNLEGATLNIAQPPEFIVGMVRVPLPSAPAVRLVTFRVLMLGQGTPAYLKLKPTSAPSLPGRMAWAPRDIADLIPLESTTGFDVVAAINTPLAAARPPAPHVVRDGGRVRLSWRIEAPPGALGHVYRGVGSGPLERIDVVPVPITAEGLDYVDGPPAVLLGSVLRYACTVVGEDGEGPLSREVEITLGQVPAAATRLLASVPNPFNPTTLVRFELDRPSAITVRIHDAAGRLVRTLVSEDLDAGTHARPWDGRDDSGRRVASGPYYIRLETPTRIDRTKVLLLK